MATATRTVTVNAAFLREIKEDNRELRDLLSRAGAALSQPVAGSLSVKALAELLADLRDQLALHFALEEAYGYFENALEDDPRLSLRADALREEHRPLYVSVCDLVNLAEQHLYREAPSRALRRIADEYRAFQQALERHETCESDLIVQALDDDIGVGD